MKERVQFTDEALVIERSVDVTPVLEHAANLRSIGATGSADFKHAACYEPEVVFAWCQQRGITYGEWLANPAHIKAMLNDPDMASFRIWKGKA